MDSLSVLLIISAGYCVLIFFDLFFKSCAHYPYLRLQEELGFTISYFSIKWKTKALNRWILKCGTRLHNFFRIWFRIGVFTSLVCIPISLFLICFSVIQIFIRDSSEEYTPLITPVIPGLNLPLLELGYYCISLLICSIVHELGHAFAAVVEDIGILEIGCNMYFILPVAYVSLSSEKIAVTGLQKKLRVFCAGVWHNIFLTFLFYLVYCSLPTIFAPLYEHGRCVSVSMVSKSSPLNDPSKGLFVDDIIIGINNCPIKNENDWYNCLSNKVILLPAICIQSDLVNSLDESVPLKHISGGYVECCDSKNKKNICFEYIDMEHNELELPDHVCLPGRTVMEQSSNFCTVGPHSCPDELHCFKPILPNNTYLFKIISYNKNVIYLGHPNDLFQTVDVSSYVKKNNLFSVKFPERVTKLVKYIVIISLGLAFVNILPFVFMDGEYIFHTLSIILLKNRFSKGQIAKGIVALTWINTFVLTIYLIYSASLILFP